MKPIIRLSTREDLDSLHQIWEQVFQSSDKDLFFDYFYRPERCIVAQIEQSVCAMGFLLPAGDFVYNDTAYPCAMIYALATLPQHRQNGLGTKIVSKLVSHGQKSGYPVTVLCPSSDDVFSYYSTQTDFREAFYTDSKTFKNLPAASPDDFNVTVLSAEEYMTLRNQRLLDQVYIRSSLSNIEYQKMLCRLSGGELYKVSDKDCCGILAVEVINNKSILIKELLCPPEYIPHILSGILIKFPNCEITVRSPVEVGCTLTENIKRFGMITSCISKISDIDLKSSWYGFAFD